MILDGSKYNPIFTHPQLWYNKGDIEIKFIRGKSKDENYLYALKGSDGMEINIFSFGTSKVGKQFTNNEWSIIKDKLRNSLNKI